MMAENKKAHNIENRLNKDMKSRIFFLSFILGVIVFIFYFFTLAPTVLWGDSAKLTQFVFERKINILKLGDLRETPQ